MKTAEHTPTTAQIQRKSAASFFGQSAEQSSSFFSGKEGTNTSSFFSPTASVQNTMGNHTIQRMADCPEHLNDNEDAPSGWHNYAAESGRNLFHCGFRTILENRTPTPEDPMNECVYDHDGVRVDENHRYAGCRGTPDQYDGHTGTHFDAVMHFACDTGGIVAEGIPAFITSRKHDINTAIETSESIPNALKPILTTTSDGLLEVIRVFIEVSFLPITLIALNVCNLINLIMAAIRVGRDIVDFFRRLTVATTSGLNGVLAFIRTEA